MELDKVESCDPAAPAEPRDHVDRLRVGEAAGCTLRHAWHDAGIEAVAIEGDDDPRSFRNMPESRFDALGVNLAGAVTMRLP